MPAELAPKSGARESAAVRSRREARARCWACLSERGWSFFFFLRGEEGAERLEKKAGRQRSRRTNAGTSNCCCGSLSLSLALSSAARSSRTLQLLDARKPYCFRAIVGGGCVWSESRIAMRRLGSVTTRSAHEEGEKKCALARTCPRTGFSSSPAEKREKDRVSAPRVNEAPFP